MKSVASRVLLAAALLTSACSLVAADEYPSRIIKLVVAAPAGGGIDIVARLIERVMSQQLGQKIIVDNQARSERISRRRVRGQRTARRLHDFYDRLRPGDEPAQYADLLRR